MRGNGDGDHIYRPKEMIINVTKVPRIDDDDGGTKTTTTICQASRCIITKPKPQGKQPMMVTMPMGTTFAWQDNDNTGRWVGV